MNIEQSPAADVAGLEEAGDRLEQVAEAGRCRARRRALTRVIATGLLITVGLVYSRRLDQRPDVPEITEGTVVWVDVKGWYQRTPHEVAAMSPFRLALDELPTGLPMAIGPWVGSERAHDPEIDVWFRDPDISIERTYRRADGEIVWLSAFGSRGDKSFHLFEHTPDLCYPLGGWQIESFDLAELRFDGPLPLPVNLGFASGTEGELVFLYLYVWDTPARSADRGVLSIRIAAPVTEDVDTTVAMLTEDFVALIFPQTLSWSRF